MPGAGAALAALALICAAPARAADPPPATDAPSSAGAREKAQSAGHFAGDWFGLRTTLRDAGITPTIGYKIETAWNAQGGARSDVTGAGQLDLGLLFDMGLIAGDEGGSVQLTISKRHGHSLVDRAGLGVLQEPQETYGRDQQWRTSELWFQQRNPAETLIVKLGRFPGGDFDDWGCDFTSLGLCGSRAGTTTVNLWYNFPIAEWGGWVKWRNDRLFVHAGVTEDNPRNLDDGFFLAKFHGAQGAFFHFEGGWTPTLGAGLAGTYQLGGWYVTSSRPDAYYDAAHQPLALTGQPGIARSGQRGFYVQAQQQVTGTGKVDPITNVLTPARGLTLGLNYVHGDRRSAQVVEDVAVEALYTAPFASRPLDQIGLAAGSSRVGDRAAATAALLTPASGRPHRETRIEGFYRYHAAPGLFLRPNAQWIVDPGGYASARDIVLLGLRADLTL